MKNIVLYSVLAVLLNACSGLYSGQLVSLDAKGDREVKDEAFGYAEARYILGVGGMNREAVMYQAKKNLFRYRPLAKNEQYVNITLDTRLRNYLLVQRVGYLIHADVEEVKAVQTGEELVRENNFSSNLEMQAGDKVYTLNGDLVKLVSVQGKRCFYIRNQKNTDDIVIESIKTTELYKAINSYQGLGLGQKITLDGDVFKSSSETLGAYRIVAFGEKSALIKREASGNVALLDYKSVER